MEGLKEKCGIAWTEGRLESWWINGWIEGERRDWWNEGRIKGWWIKLKDWRRKVGLMELRKDKGLMEKMEGGIDGIKEGYKVDV